MSFKGVAAVRPITTCPRSRSFQISKRRLRASLLLNVAALAAQPTPALRFAAAAIRSHAAIPSRDAGNGKMITVGPKISFSGSRATIENASLGNLIDFAYGLNFDSISGAPHWADAVRFDISAKAEGERVRTKEELRRMLQTLLAERFDLKFHLKTIETSGYSLVVAKDGPKLTKSAPDAESSMSMRSPGNAAEMTVTKWTMAQLAAQLSLMTGQAKDGAIVP